MFVLAAGECVAGTSYTTEIYIKPLQLIEMFGEPEGCDEYKSSGMYVFKDWEDNVITLYDWKATNLYNDSCPTPDEFWNSNQLRELHIGSAGAEAGKRFKAILESITED